MGRKIQWTIEYAESQIEQWQRIRDTIQRSDVQAGDSLETKVFKLYLRYTSVTEVAKILSADGVRVPSASGSRVISSNDVSEIIRGAEIPDKDLQALVRNIHSNATKVMNYLYN